MLIAEEETDPVLIGLLSLLWRLPPQDTTRDVFSLCAMNNDRADLILQRVQRPSHLIFDSVHKRFFLGNDFNKSAGAYRSPWGGSDMRFYDRGGVELESDERGSIAAAKAIRELETYFNTEMKKYCTARYPNGHSSVFAWEFPKQVGFGVAIHFQSNVELMSKIYKKCLFTWDITHVIHTQIAHSTHALYRIKTTLYVNMVAESDDLGKVDFGTRSINMLDSSKHTGHGDGATEANAFHVGNIMNSIAEAETALMAKIREEAVPRSVQALAALRFLNASDAKTHFKITSEINELAVADDSA